MAFHMYVDESKTPNYLLMGVLVPEAQVVELRAAMRSLLLPGQERIHFTAERPARRQSLLAAMVGMGLTAYGSEVSGLVPEAKARPMCMYALAELAVQLRVTSMVIEQDDSHVPTDRVAIRAALKASGNEAAMSYRWLRSRQEQLLGLPDAFAWTWAQGGSWRQLLRGHVQLVTQAP